MLQIKINKFLLIYILILPFVSLTNPKKATNQLNQVKWNALSEKLIELPQKQANSRKSLAHKVFESLTLSTIFGASLAFAIGGISVDYDDNLPTVSNQLVIFDQNLASHITQSLLARYLYTNKLVKKLLSINCFFGKKRLIASLLASLLLMPYAYKKLRNSTLAKEEQKAFKIFIENWETNKTNTPEKLQLLLDNAYLNYKENPKQVDLSEISRIVKRFIMNKKENIAILKNN